MVAWMNADVLKTYTGKPGSIFLEPEPEELWHKGATSGNFLKVVEIWADCDGDTLLLKVLPEGPACHTGEQSCFFREVGGMKTGKQGKVTVFVIWVDCIGNVWILLMIEG